MKYQLVALFDNESYPKVEQIQKSVCRKYRLYKNTPKLYISIGTICDPDMEMLEYVINKILKPYKQFKVKVNNSIGLNDNNKKVNLKIDKKGYIIRIARNINDTLNLYGFKTNVTDIHNMNLSIPLANANYNIKKACNRSSIPVDKKLLTEDYLRFAKIDRIELWKLSGNKSNVIKSFPLRHY